MPPQKRQTDFQVISNWIDPRATVLDVGCGRGLLLEHLVQTRDVKPLGVDIDITKIQSCVKRSIPAYHGNADTLLAEFPDRFFDWVILSRTIQDLPSPGKAIENMLRVGQNVAVGFVNYAYWRNRLSFFREGAFPVNEVFATQWNESHPTVPVSIRQFIQFARTHGINISAASFLRGDWLTPTNFLPNLTAGYALFHLTRI